MDFLRTEIDGPVATLVLDRPARRNALTQSMWADVPRLLAEVAAQPGVRALLVRSAVEGVFCAGADVSEYRDNAGDVEWGIQSQARVAAALAAIRSLRVPTIASIDGACVGGGAAIVLACDLRLCSIRATFAITPAKLGLVFPAEDIAALVALVGVAEAKHMLFTGRLFDADWAVSAGFVNGRYSPEELAHATDELVRSVASVSPSSVSSMKELIGAVGETGPAASARIDEIVSESLRSADHLEGVTAFLERRAPHFTGTP